MTLEEWKEHRGGIGRAGASGINDKAIILFSIRRGRKMDNCFVSLYFFARSRSKKLITGSSTTNNRRTWKRNTPGIQLHWHWSRFPCWCGVPNTTHVNQATYCNYRLLKSIYCSNPQNMSIYKCLSSIPIKSILKHFFLWKYWFLKCTATMRPLLSKSQGKFEEQLAAWEVTQNQCCRELCDHAGFFKTIGNWDSYQLFYQPIPLYQIKPAQRERDKIVYRTLV